MPAPQPRPYIPNQSLPYSETWNLGVQHMFAQKYTLDVRYVGTRGIHLPVQARLNRQTKTSLQHGTCRPSCTNPGQAHWMRCRSRSTQINAEQQLRSRLRMRRASTAPTWSASRTTELLQLQRPADAVQPQLHQRPAVPGGLDLEPCLRQLDSRRLLDRADAASSAGLPELRRRLEHFGSGSPSSLSPSKPSTICRSSRTPTGS